MRKYFKAATHKDDDGWMMADAGKSTQADDDFVITTNSLHVDEVPMACNDAKTFCQLVAGLLNCFYNRIETKPYTEEQMINFGTVTENEHIPSPLNPKLPF